MINKTIQTLLLFCLISFAWSQIDQISAEKGFVRKDKMKFLNGSGFESNASGNLQVLTRFELRDGLVLEDFTDQFQEAIEELMTGAITAFAMPDGSLPDGWVLCDGTVFNTVENTDLQRLANKIRDTWGGTGLVDTNGNWVGTFAVPDLRGMFLRGDSDFNSPGDVITSSKTGLPVTPFEFALTSSGAHTHPFHDLIWTDPNTGPFTTLRDNADKTSNSSTIRRSFTNTSDTTTGSSHSHSYTATSGGDVETRPRNIALIWMIKD